MKRYLFPRSIPGGKEALKHIRPASAPAAGPEWPDSSVPVSVSNEGSSSRPEPDSRASAKPILPSYLTSSSNAAPKEVTEDPYIAAEYRARGCKPALRSSSHASGHGLFCQSCGTRLESFSTCEHILGINYCRKCYEVLLPQATLECKDCGQTIQGKCRDCFLHHLEDVRQFIKPYGERFDAALREHGIHPQQSAFEGIDPYGRALVPVPELSSCNLIPLREKLGMNQERALYTVNCRGDLFAIPDSMIGIRYITAHDPAALGKHPDLKEPASRNTIRSTSYILALRSDGEYLYYLTMGGYVLSENPSITPFSLFDPVQEADRMIKAVITPGQIEQKADEIRKSTVYSFSSQCYYDPRAKVFFSCLVDGNYYHGYDVSYPVLTKENALNLTRISNLYTLHQELIKGIVPNSAVIEVLEEGPYIENYDPPERVGYGTLWI